MYISTKASCIRQREAQRARDNRAEIVKAPSIGQVPLDRFHWHVLRARWIAADGWRRSICVPQTASGADARCVSGTTLAPATCFTKICRRRAFLRSVAMRS